MRTRLIVVVGSGSELSKENAELAERLGAALVRANFGVVTNGRGGVAEAVSRGATRKRGKSTHPPIVGILAGADASAGNAYLDVAIPTGLGRSSHAVLAMAGEALICLGGATGALAEVALARKSNRPVLALAPSGGTAALLAKVMDSVESVDSIEAVIDRLGELLPR